MFVSLSYQAPLLCLYGTYVALIVTLTD